MWNPNGAQTRKLQAAPLMNWIQFNRKSQPKSEKHKILTNSKTQSLISGVWWNPSTEPLSIWRGVLGSSMVHPFSSQICVDLFPKLLTSFWCVCWINSKHLAAQPISQPFSGFDTDTTKVCKKCFQNIICSPMSIGWIRYLLTPPHAGVFRIYD